MTQKEGPAAGGTAGGADGGGSDDAATNSTQAQEAQQEYNRVLAEALAQARDAAIGKALFFRALGVSFVYPCDPRDGRPLTDYATDNEWLIRRWWEQWPTADVVTTDTENSGLQERWRSQTERQPPTRARLLQSSKQFVADYKPPDYLIVGLLQRRFLYAMTGPTGSGKTAIAMRFAAHVDQGLEICGKKVKRGRVLYFAGENPEDVRARWIKLCEDMKLDPDVMEVVFMPGSHDLRKMRKQIDAEVVEFGPIALLIVDTNAAYFTGDDENSRTQLGDHARMLRTFCNLPGGPTVLVTCHPIKNPSMDNMVPAGGGSFLNEVDGNLAVLKQRGSMIVEIDTHGKWRGPEFATLFFKIVPGTSLKLIDTEGNEIWTVISKPATEAEKTASESISHKHQDAMLLLLRSRTDLSFTEMARALDWKDKDGDPHKRLAQSIIEQLKKDQLVEKNRDHYELTVRGKKAADSLAAQGKAGFMKDEELPF